jgi:hypothetical protein
MSPSGRIELLRRALLICLVLVGVWLWWLAPLPALVSVEPVDFAAEQQLEAQRHPAAFMPEAQRRRLALEPPAYVEEVTRGLVVPVGTEWTSFLREVDDLFEGRIAGRNRRARLSPDFFAGNSGARAAFYRPDEGPLAALESRWPGPQATLYLRQAGEAGDRWYRARRWTYASDDFHYGLGLNVHPRPASAVFFPFRRWTPWLLLAAVAAFVALPWHRQAKNEAAWPRWRIVLGDLIGLVLLVFFFAIPMFVLGGSVQAVTRGTVLAIVCWAFAASAVYLFLWSARYAALRLVTLPHGFRVDTVEGSRELRFTEVERVEPVRFRSPRWFHGLMWLAVLLARGSQRAGAAGRAILWGASDAQGLRFVMRDGSDVWLHATDAFGNPAVPGIGRFLRALEKANVPHPVETTTLTAILPPTGTASLGRDARRRTVAIFLAVALGPPVLLMLISLLVTG